LPGLFIGFLVPWCCFSCLVPTALLGLTTAL